MTSNNFLDLTKYRILGKIGHGGFGDVYCVEDNSTDHVYAAKISKDEITENGLNSQNLLIILREINIISSINHPSIIHYVGFSPIDFNSTRHPTIVLEYAPHGALRGIIDSEMDSHSHKKWNETKKLICVYGIANGMANLHKNQIIHRNLKPENVLMDENFFPKISDFGLSMIYNLSSESTNVQSNSSFKSSPLYIAPEVFTNNEYSEKSDVYSFAFIVYQIVTKVTPLKNLSFCELMNFVLRGERPDFPNDIEKSYRDLIQICWDQNPKKRPFFDDIVDIIENKHDFITDSIDEVEFFEYVNFLKEQKNENQTELKVSIYPLHEIDKLDQSCQIIVKEAEKNPVKQFIVGKYLIEGIEKFPRNIQLGMKYLQLARLQKYKDALIYLSDMYTTGEIIPEDLDEARKILDEVDDKNDASFLYSLGMIEKKENNYEIAFDLLQKSSKLGKAEAMFYCGEMLMNGQGVDKDESKGKKYLDLAKKNGCTLQYEPQTKEDNESKKKSENLTNVKIKVVCVGPCTGKTYTLHNLVGLPPPDYMPTVFDNHILKCKFNDIDTDLNLWDTSGCEDLQKIRVLCYPNTDVFVLFFSLNDEFSLKRLSDFFIPEIISAIKNKKPTFMLVGTFLDERIEDDSFKKQIDQFIKKYGINKVIFVSNITKENIQELSQEILKTGFEVLSSNSQQKSCNIF